VSDSLIVIKVLLAAEPCFVISMYRDHLGSALALLVALTAHMLTMTQVFMSQRSLMVEQLQWMAE